MVRATLKFKFIPPFAISLTVVAFVDKVARMETIMDFTMAPGTQQNTFLEFRFDHIPRGHFLRDREVFDPDLNVMEVESSGTSVVAADDTSTS